MRLYCHRTLVLKFNLRNITCFILNLRIADYGTMLGSGFYGTVFKGTVKGEVVAAKTVRQNIEREMLLALLAEIKLMSKLDYHKNVVSFVGTCTKKLSKGELCLKIYHL